MRSLPESTVRYSPNHKTETHEQIVETAAAQFRQHGVNGVGVAQLMKNAGLTHGGFYAHFPSKEALVAEALESAFRQTAAGLRKVADEAPPEQRRKAVVDAYLSTRHRDEMGGGCALPALGADVARSSPETRQVFEARVLSMLKLLEPGDDDTARQEAIAVLAAMVGGMILARGVLSPTLSDEILEAVRNRQAS
jgi:TetR/AcrR family transcriptional repressor of nem operon